MRSLASALLFALVVQEPVCDHGTRGPSAAIHLKDVARFHDEMSQPLGELGVERPAGVTWPAFDSGLPACRSRKTRRQRVESLPPGMKPLLFAPAGSDVPSDVLLVATRARSLREVSSPADPGLAARLGVLCHPTFVRPVSTTEVELTEGERP
jgi:hypothetical protein